MAKTQYFLKCHVTNRYGAVSTVEFRVMAYSETEAVHEAEERYDGSDVEVVILRPE
jgi:hypothetical protein